MIPTGSMFIPHGPASPATPMARRKPGSWRRGARRMALLLVALAAGAAQAKPRAKPPRLPLWDRALIGRWRQADALLRQAVKSARAHRYVEAQTALRRALRLRPDAAPLWFALGSVHSLSGRYARCIQELRRSRALDPRYAPGLVAFRLGLCLSMTGKLAEAMHAYQLAGRHSSVRAGVLHWNVADTLMAMGRLAEAISAYRKAIIRMPREAVLRFALAVALHRQGRFDAARRPLRQGLRLDPTARSLSSPSIVWMPAAEPLYYRALVQVGQGHLTQAVETWGRFLRAEPTTPWRWAIRTDLRRQAAGPLPQEVLRSVRGSLSRASVIKRLNEALGGLRACLGAPPTARQSRTLPAAVALRLSLRQGRLARIHVIQQAGPVPPDATPCLRRTLQRIRWRAAVRGRAPATFTVSLLGRI